jgi:chromosome segregation ATPase
VRISILAKSTYTDEEINQFFQELFLEKKKSKELTDSLQKQSLESVRLQQELEKIQQLPSTSNPSSKEEIDRLKKIISVFKLKYEKTLLEVKMREEKLKETEQEKTTLATKEEEIRALVSQMATLKDYYLKSQKQTQEFKIESERLKKIIADLNETSQSKKASEIDEEKEQLRKELNVEKLRSRDLQALIKANDEKDLEKNLNLEKELETAKFAADNKERELLNLQDEITKSYSKIANLERKNIDLTNQWQDALAYKEMTLAAQKRLTEFEKQLSDAEDENEELKNEKHIASLRKNETELELETSQIKFNELEEKLRKQAFELGKIDHSLHESSEENQLLYKQIETLKHHLLKTQNELKQLSETHCKILENSHEKEKLQSDLQQKIHLIEPELGEVKKAYQQSLKRIKDEEGIKYELNWKIKNLEIESSEIKKTYQKSLDNIQNYEETIQKLQLTIGDLKSELLQNESFKQALAKAEKDVEEAHLQLDEVQAQNGREKQKTEKLVRVIKEKERRIEELQQIEITLKRTSDLKAEIEKALEEECAKYQILNQEKWKAIEDLNEKQQHSEQLERVIQFLRERSQEAQLELKQLREEYQNSQVTVNQLNEQVNRSSAENLKQRELLQQEKKEKEEVYAEMKLLQTQFESLRHLIHSINLELNQAHADLNLKDQEHEILKKEKLDLEVSLTEKMKCLEVFEKEISLIKQTLIRALREAKELESIYHETVKEKVTITAKLHQFQYQIEKYREQENSLKNQVETSYGNLAETNKILEEFRLEYEKIQAQLEDEKRLQREMLDLASLETEAKSKEIVDLKIFIEHKKEEIDQFQNHVNEQQHKMEEQENEIKKAQQHLAKKVKEMAILEDKFENQNNLLAELQKTIAQDNIRIAELQTGLDLQIHHHKRLEEQLQENSKAADLQQTKWEEKYFAIYEKWQGADGRIKELEKLEDKYKQLQGLLSNLGSFIGEPSGFIQPPATVSKELPTAVSKPVEDQNTPKKPYQNLFDMPKPPQRPRQNLLD